MTPAEIGELIERVGLEWQHGRLTFPAALDAIRAADPTLSVQGATMQLRSWRGAADRWALASQPVAPVGRIDTRGNNRRPTLRITFPKSA